MTSTSPIPTLSRLWNYMKSITNTTHSYLSSAKAFFPSLEPYYQARMWLISIFSSVSTTI